MTPLVRAFAELLIAMARVQASSIGEKAPGVLHMLGAAAGLETLLRNAEGDNARG